MNEVIFHALSMTEKAAFVRENGHFIEARDFYSYFVLVYLFNKHQIELLYDYSGRVVAVETIEETPHDDFITNQLQTSLDTLD